MKIKVIEMNVNGCSTAFDVDGHPFSTSIYGDGLYYKGQEIIPPNFFSLNQKTKSGRWKAIKREFEVHNDLIWYRVKEIEDEREHEKNMRRDNQDSNEYI